MPGDVGKHPRVVLSRKADATRAWPCPSSYDRFGTISAVRLGANLSPPIVANWVANHRLPLGRLADQEQKLGAGAGWRVLWLVKARANLRSGAEGVAGNREAHEPYRDELGEARAVTVHGGATRAVGSSRLQLAATV